MDDDASIWGNLGSGMSLPSSMRDQIERMQMELRDMKLQVAKETMEVANMCESISMQLEAIQNAHLSILTRLEGLEARAQVASAPHRDDFNAFAYISHDEVEEFNQLQIEESSHGETSPDEEPVGLSVEQEMSDGNEDASYSEESSDIDQVLGQFISGLVELIELNGHTYNNTMFIQVYGKKEWKELQEQYPDLKQLAKDYIEREIESDEGSLSSKKISKMRSAIFLRGQEPENL